MSRRYYALVPAAGRGERMGSEKPKQYLMLDGHPLLYHCVRRLCQYPAIDRVLVILSPTDREWARHSWQDLGNKLQAIGCGGETRADTVRNGLKFIQETIKADDGVLVHDGARPFVSQQDLDCLFAQAAKDFSAGCLLALPAVDTLKKEGAGRTVAHTLERQGVWLAQTPQLFPYHLLQRALATCDSVTDEAAAIEALGLAPTLVQGDGSSFKITRQSDLRLAAAWLASEGSAPALAAAHRAI